MKYRIIAVSCREIVWAGLAVNPRHARKQAEALLGRRFLLPKYITLNEREDYAWNGIDQPISFLIM